MKSALQGEDPNRVLFESQRGVEVPWSLALLGVALSLAGAWYLASGEGPQHHLPWLIVAVLASPAAARLMGWPARIVVTAEELLIYDGETLRRKLPHAQFRRLSNLLGMPSIIFRDSRLWLGWSSDESRVVDFYAARSQAVEFPRAVSSSDELVGPIAELQFGDNCTGCGAPTSTTATLELSKGLYVPFLVHMQAIRDVKVPACAGCKAKRFGLRLGLLSVLSALVVGAIAQNYQRASPVGLGLIAGLTLLGAYELQLARRWAEWVGLGVRVVKSPDLATVHLRFRRPEARRNAGPRPGSDRAVS